MSTFIFNLNDTTALSDSVVAIVLKLSETSQPIVTEAETNGFDVIIVCVICLAIVLVALIAMCGFLSWKKAELEALKEERKEKNENDNNECERKTRNDLIDKLLDALKNQAVIKDKQGKIIGYKGYKTEEFVAYKEAMEKYIDQSNAEINEEKMS